MEVHVVTYNIHGLPWVTCPHQAIAEWMAATVEAPLLCFQEAFTAKGRSQITRILETHGYDVYTPHDEGVSLLCSGLLTAVDRRRFRVLTSCFQPFLAYKNVEIFANKGFHILWLEDCWTHRRFFLVNTHTNSDPEIPWFTGNTYKEIVKVRRKQAEQIIDYFARAVDPVLVVGDLNQEVSLHPHLRSLQPVAADPRLKKRTFLPTGQDLDHVAWLPLQWASSTCVFCLDQGPQLLRCKVHDDKHWSDHAPVEMVLHIPPRSDRK
jgi:hypothetical protein